MSEYAAFFFEDPRQIVALASIALIWFGLAALGSFIGGREADKPMYPLLGWAAVVVVYTLAGTLTDVPFTMLAAALGAAALVSAAVFVRRDRWLIDPVYLRMLVWAAPLLLLVSAMQGSHWDEFSHWLTGQKYLLNVDRFPGEGHPKSAASFPAYPYAWQLLAYFAGRIQGGVAENAGALLNILLLLTLGLLAVRRALFVTGRDEAGIHPWLFASLAVAAATIFNPTFVQKVILTAYADLATSVTLAAGVVAGWWMLDALGENDERRARKAALLSGLIFAVLVSLKQSTLELFGLGVGALFFVGLVDPRIRFASLVRCAVLITLPAVVVYGVWRYYVANELAGREFTIRPFDDWSIDLLPSILGNMVYVLLKKSAYLAAMLAAVIVGARAVMGGGTAYSRAMLTIALIFLGHTAFLAFCYVAVFHGYEAKTIASYWRYNQQLGGLAVLAITLSGAVLLTRFGGRLPLAKLKWLPAVLIVIGPLAFAEKLRFDKAPAYAHYRGVAQTVAARIEPGSKVRVLDPQGSGESGIIMRYEASDKTLDVAYQAAFHNMSEKGLRTFRESLDGSYLLVHSVTAPVQAVFGADLKPGVSYLLRIGAAGSVEILATWPWPAN